MRTALLAVSLIVLPLPASAQSVDEPASATGATKDAAGRVVLTFETPAPRHRFAPVPAPQPPATNAAAAQPRRVAHKGGGEAWTPAIALNQPRP